MRPLKLTLMSYSFGVESAVSKLITTSLWVFAIMIDLNSPRRNSTGVVLQTAWYLKPSHHLMINIKTDTMLLLVNFSKESQRKFFIKLNLQRDNKFKRSLKRFKEI